MFHDLLIFRGIRVFVRSNNSIPLNRIIPRIHHVSLHPFSAILGRGYRAHVLDRGITSWLSS